MTLILILLSVSLSLSLLAVLALTVDAPMDETKLLKIARRLNFSPDDTERFVREGIDRRKEFVMRLAQHIKSEATDNDPATKGNQ